MEKHQDPCQESGAQGQSDSERAFAINLMRHLVVPTFVLDTACKVIVWNIACEKLTGVLASEVLGTSDHWRGFYDAPRPCLADLVVQGRVTEVGTLYAQHEDTGEVHYGLYAENWCVMPRLGNRLYLALDCGPIYDNEGRLIAAVETLRDMTIQKEAQAALEQLAHRDGLTGIANRRSFDRTLDTEWRRALRKSKSLTLLMLDVDHFKGYNDTYGHQAGDDCLRRVAAAMAHIPVRVSDQVARYGGEEFAVILPDVNLQGAGVVAERIRVAVEQLALVNRASTTGRVTVSIGVASMTAKPDQTPAQLIAWADAALFEAKRQGRNRVVVRPLDAPVPPLPPLQR